MASPSPTWEEWTFTKIRDIALTGSMTAMVLVIAQAYVLWFGPEAALVEVPYNLVQVTVGVVAGMAASVAFEKALL